MGQLIDFGATIAQGVQTGSMLGQNMLEGRERGDTKKAITEYTDWVKGAQPSTPALPAVDKPTSLTESAADPARSEGKRYSNLTKLAEEYEKKAKFVEEAEKKLLSMSNTGARKELAPQVALYKGDLEALRTKLTTAKSDMAAKEILSLQQFYLGGNKITAKDKDGNPTQTSWDSYRNFTERKLRTAVADRLNVGDTPTEAETAAIEREVAANMKQMPKEYSEDFVNDQLGNLLTFKEAGELQKHKMSMDKTDAALAAVEQRDRASQRQLQGLLAAVAGRGSDSHLNLLSKVAESHEEEAKLLNAEEARLQKHLGEIDKATGATKPREKIPGYIWDTDNTEKVQAWTDARTGTETALAKVAEAKAKLERKIEANRAEMNMYGGSGKKTPPPKEAPSPSQYTKENPASGLTQASFDKLPSGSFYINPADKKVYRKK